MRFSEIPYKRPDIAEISAEYDKITKKVLEADSAAEQLAAFGEHEKLYSHIDTLSSLVYIRYSTNTKDEFYVAEQEFMDEASPVLQEKFRLSIRLCSRADSVPSWRKSSARLSSEKSRLPAGHSRPLSSV